MTGLPPSQVPPDDAAPWWRRRAAWLYDSVAEGVLRDHSEEGTPAEWPLVTETIGALSLPGGRLVTGEPFWGVQPVVQVLAERPYDITIVRATVGPDHHRNAAAVLHDGTAPVVAWEQALLPGQDPATLGPGEFFGYGVDAGTGCFAGEDGAAALLASMEEYDDPTDSPLFVAMETSDPPRDHAFGRPSPGAPPVAVFGSGWGDGRYPTWLGRAASGEVVVAVTDFLLAEDPYTVPDPPPAAPPRPPSLWRRLLGR